MRLFPKLKLSPRLGRVVYTRLLQIGYHFVDLDAESSSLEDSRFIEISFVLSGLLKKERGKVLDIGCTDSGNIAPLVLASLGWEAYGIDIREGKFEHPNFHFIRGDIRKTSFPNNFFDYAYAISTLEHIGLKGRYSVTEEDPQGDIKATEEIARIVRPGGIFLVTIPYGRGKLVKPLCRVYDKFRLQKLFSQEKTTKEIYYTLKQGCWVTVSEEVAAEIDFLRGERALALLELTLLK